MDNNLQHYASPYYDPQKAHEYYMRTRELKDAAQLPSFRMKERKSGPIPKTKSKPRKRPRLRGNRKSENRL